MTEHNVCVWLDFTQIKDIILIEEEFMRTKKTLTEVTPAKIEETAAEVKKETAKPAEKKTAVKKPAIRKPAAAKKTGVKETIYLQYLGKEINKDDVIKSVKDVWTKQMKQKVGDLKSIDLYLKPEENAVYYVINGDVTGSLDI